MQQSYLQNDPFLQFNVASYKRPGIRLSFKHTTTLLSGEGGEGRTGTATMFRKVLSKYTIFSTVLSKIVDRKLLIYWDSEARKNTAIAIEAMFDGDGDGDDPYDFNNEERNKIS